MPVHQMFLLCVYAFGAALPAGGCVPDVSGLQALALILLYECFSLGWPQVFRSSLMRSRALERRISLPSGATTTTSGRPHIPCRGFSALRACAMLLC